MNKRLKFLVLLLMVMPLIFLGGCDIVADFINTTWGYLIIGGAVLYFVFKYGGKNK